MKDGQSDFLDDLDPEPAESADAQTQDPEPQPEPQGRARDDKGRFAKTQQELDDEAEQQGEQEPQPAAPPEPPSGNEGPHVPRAALEAERKKRQQLEAELAKLRQPQTQSAPQQPQPNTPRSSEFSPPQVDYRSDPATFLMSQTPDPVIRSSIIAAAQFSSPLEVAEAWNAFNEACLVDESLAAWSGTLLEHPHPAGEVLKWYKRHSQSRMLEEAGGLEKLIEARVAEALAARGAGAQPAPAMNGQATPAPKPAVPPSLARGGSGVVDAPDLPNEDDDFKSFFAGARQPRKR